MDTITLSENDDRRGVVDEKNNLVYPGADVFGNPIPVRSAVQVEWVIAGESFVCFPATAKTDDYLVVQARGETSEYSTFDEDGDRDTEDAADDESVDLSEMTKAQLLDLAASRGLTLSDRLNKQALIDALTGD